MKKILIAMMAGCMTLSLLTSCNNSSSTSSSEPESSGDSSSQSSQTAESSEAEESGYTVNFDEDPYNVHFLYISMGRDFSGVQEAVNELALSEMNMTVELNPQSWGTYYGTLSMLLAANADLDLIENFGQSTQTWIDSGYIQDWSPYLDNIPDITADLQENIDACYFGGMLAGIPVNKEYTSGLGLLVREDILEEVGYSVSDFSVDVNDLSSFDQLTELFEAVHQAYPNMIVYGGMNSLVSQSTIDLDGLGNTLGVLDQETLQFYNYYESERFTGLCNLAREWFNAGYISSDAAVNEDMGEILVTAGNLFSYSTITKPNTAIEATSKTGKEMVLIKCGNPLMKTDGVNGTMYCLSSASEDPEKATACYNWMYTSAAFNDLINWGVEGVDWIEDENGQAAYPEGVTADNVVYHNDMGFGYPNQFVGHVWEGNPETIWEDYEEWNSSAPRSVAFGLVFDSSDYIDPLSLCQAVEDQYMQEIGFGTVDPETRLAQFNEDLYNAGLQTLIDAKQEQFDAWYAENN